MSDDLGPRVSDSHAELVRLHFIERMIERLGSSLKWLHTGDDEGLAPRDMMALMVDNAEWDAPLDSIEVAERLAEQNDPFNAETSAAFRAYATHTREHYRGPGAAAVRGQRRSSIGDQLRVAARIAAQTYARPRGRRRGR